MSGLIKSGTWAGEEEPLAVLVRPGGKEVLVVRPSLCAVVLDSQGSLLVSVEGRWGDWTSACWLPRGDGFLLGSTRGTVVSAGFPDGGVRSVHTWGKSWVSSLAVSSDGKTGAAGVGKALVFWDLVSGDETGRWEGFPSTVTGLDWYPGGALAACSYGGVRIFSPGLAEPSRHLEWQGSALEVLWSPDRKYLATVEQDRTVHLWTYPGGLDMRMGVFQTKASGTRWIRGGRYLMTTGDLDAVVWDCSGKGPEGRSPLLLEGHSLPVRGVAEVGGRTATLGEDGRLILWTNDWIRDSKMTLDAPGSFLAGAGEDLLVTADTDGEVIFWKVSK